MRSTPEDKEAARARAQALRGERAARARKIRRQVISGAVALFIAAWLMITIMLVSGHDPALASKASNTTSSATTVASTPSATTTTPSTTTTTTSSSTSGSSSSSSGVSSVTTSQS